MFPQSGPARSSLGTGLRVAFAKTYAIYYVFDERDVVVIRVLHGARDVAAWADKGGFD